MRRYHKIIIESYNPKGDSLVIGNLPSNDMVHYYGELRALSESYGMNVSLKDANIHITPSSLSSRGMLEGINKFMDNHAYDPTFAEGSETVVYTKTNALIENTLEQKLIDEGADPEYAKEAAAAHAAAHDPSNPAEKKTGEEKTVTGQPVKETPPPPSGNAQNAVIVAKGNGENEFCIKGSSKYKDLFNNIATSINENVTDACKVSEEDDAVILTVKDDSDNNDVLEKCKQLLDNNNVSVEFSTAEGQPQEQPEQKDGSEAGGEAVGDADGETPVDQKQGADNHVVDDTIPEGQNEPTEPVSEQEDPQVTKIKVRYKNIFASIPLMTQSDEDAAELENVVVYLLTKSANKDKWIEHINNTTNDGKSIIAIRKKLLPQIAAKTPNKIVLNSVNANGTIDGDEAESNIQGSGFIVPKRYSKDMKPPVLDSKQLVITKFGFPMLNCETKTMQILMSDSYDKDTKKPLLKEFINKIKNTELANALGRRWGVLDRIMEMKKVQGLLPMVHKNMKVTSVDEIIAGAEGGTVNCIPVEDSNGKFESTDMHGNPLFELGNPIQAIKNFIHGGKANDKNIPSSFGKEMEIHADYLAQFYELADFTDPEGEALYLRYTSKADMDEMRKIIGDDKDGKEPTSKKEMWTRYLAKTKGRPPFYVMQEKTKFQEGIRVSPKPYLRNLYLVKTIVKVGGSKGNRAMYFLTEDQKDTYFTLG